MADVPLSIKYVEWVSRHRRGGNGSAYAQIFGPNQASLDSPPGTTISTDAQTLSLPYSAGQLSTFNPTAAPQVQYQFAFYSILGSVNGPAVYQQSYPPVSPQAGSSILCMVVFVELGSGPGSNEVDIDAFDVTTGLFVDNPFVTVTPDASLTAAANQDGTVPTTSQELVTANPNLLPGPSFGTTNPAFQSWQVAWGAEATNLSVLTAAKNSSAIAFAFYKDQCVVSIAAGNTPTSFDGTAHMDDSAGNPLTLTLTASQPYCGWNLIFLDVLPFGGTAFVQLATMMGNGSQAVTFTVNENDTGMYRSMKIGLSENNYVTISQAPKAPVVCQYAISLGPPYPAKMTLPGVNGTAFISVMTSPDCGWTASVVGGTAKPIFLHVASLLPTNPSAGKGNGTVSFQMSGNGDSCPVTSPPYFIGTLLIAGFTVLVYQSPHGPFGPPKRIE